MLQTGGHAAIEHAADGQPVAVAFAIAREEGLFRCVTSMRCSAETEFREMTQGGMKHRLVAAICSIVVGWLPQQYALLRQPERIASRIHGGGEMNGHLYETLMLFFWRERAYRGSF